MCTFNIWAFLVQVRGFLNWKVVSLVDTPLVARASPSSLPIAHINTCRSCGVLSLRQTIHDSRNIRSQNMTGQPHTRHNIPLNATLPTCWGGGSLRMAVTLALVSPMPPVTMDSAAAICCIPTVCLAGCCSDADSPAVRALSTMSAVCAIV